MKQNNNYQAFRIGACCGLLVGALVILYGYVVSEGHMPALNDWLIVLMCPPSMFLISLEHASKPVVVFYDVFIISANAAWYGFVFAVVGLLFRRLRSTRPSNQ